MLPLSLLKTAINHPMLVELKNGETYNGHLASCDAWMNVYLTQVICTSRDGDRFWKIPECYIRGSTIKYLRIPDEVVENYKDEPSRGQQIRKDQMRRGAGSGQRGGRGGQSNRGGRQPSNLSSNVGGSTNSIGGARPAKQQRR
ncbi:U6 snRNA-associated Sm LSm4 [Brachionus plicatilis]|uniref:U6 snRNA-associated Sm-like protein LSm4 n=1 Tax=Brachionus plicatilis TaxID=10195 RepID=A0A3M7RXU5_BRAPC|nr:U6 snRNA-associated Sm LSm4 [Brachionus plicatilis]